MTDENKMYVMSKKSYVLLKGILYKYYNNKHLLMKDSKGKILLSSNNHYVPLVINGKEMLIFNDENKKLRRKNKDKYDYFNIYYNVEQLNYIIDSIPSTLSVYINIQRKSSYFYYFSWIINNELIYEETFDVQKEPYKSESKATKTFETFLLACGMNHALFFNNEQNTSFQNLKRRRILSE